MHRFSWISFKTFFLDFNLLMWIDGLWWPDFSRLGPYFTNVDFWKAAQRLFLGIEQA